MALWLSHSLNLDSSNPFGLYFIFPKPAGDLHQRYQYQDTSSWGRNKDQPLSVTYSPARAQAKQVAEGQPMIHLMALDMGIFLYA